jgi:hypothetical protein
LRAARLAVPIFRWLHPSGIDAEAAAATRVEIAVGSVDELGALRAQAASTVRVHLHVGHRNVPWRLVRRRERQTKSRSPCRGRVRFGYVGDMPCCLGFRYARADRGGRALPGRSRP